MELRIHPTDLYAASAALSACSARLDDAVVTFARESLTALPQVGAQASDAARRGIVAADRAAQIISTDIDRLAHALAALAHHYPRVDATAVPRR